MSLPLRGFAVLLAVVAACALARPADAEEALVLDNGVMIRGIVLQEDAHSLLFRVSGIGSDSKIRVARSRIVQRFVTVERSESGTTSPSPTLVERGVAPRVVDEVAISAPAPVHIIPEEEPPAAAETFFQRTARRAALALPSDAGARAFLAALAIVVVLCLVGLAARMVDVQGMTLGRGTILAVLYVGLIALDVAWSDAILRADRAPMFVPLQLLAWMGCAAAILRCGIGRAFHLLAFVAVASSLVVFSAGIVLVSV